METKVPTGTEAMDWLLEGGYENDVITCIYGPPGSGKTNFCMLCMARGVKDGKIIYIDTENSFSAARFKQIAPDHKEILKNAIFLRPINFDEQHQAFEKLQKIITNKVSLIVLDSVAMLYRLELGKTKDTFSVNRKLGLQLSILAEIARRNKIPIIMTNQVYSDIDHKDSDMLKMVGGDILKYQSKCLIELKRDKNGVREAILRKHRSLPDGKRFYFDIIESGIEEHKKEE
ncbi:DNA repair and recombination protein RadB [Candidatus Woesearchaeota archaeon]|nr:DNA repair and recombination protein RadB [Candidatus Woesearchaeota archaeon]